MLWRLLLGAALVVGVVWLILVAMLASQARRVSLREAARLVPDTIRLLKRIASDGSVPLRVRARIWLLFVYLAIPLDLIPDFLPIVGYADDAVLVVACLRSVVRGAGRARVEQHWPGTPDGLAALRRLAGIRHPDSGTAGRRRHRAAP
jgi:uncharacterized membrane protein YkvA (DUF1232 family)